MANPKFPDISAEFLRSVLSYSKTTGVFRWKTNRGRVKAGTIAGSLHRKHGYIQIGLCGKDHKAARLAWLYMTGGWPSQLVDHKNGNRSDNRWSNLRDLGFTANLQNMRKAHKDNVSGLLGVTWSREKQRFFARIQVNKRAMRLGYFDTAEAAHSAYLKAKRRLHASCTI